jgi:hypothetical protein
MDELLAAIRGVADDGTHLAGVHLIPGHEVDHALGIDRPFPDPVYVAHAVKVTQASHLPSVGMRNVADRNKGANIRDLESADDRSYFMSYRNSGRLSCKNLPIVQAKILLSRSSPRRGSPAAELWSAIVVIKGRAGTSSTRMRSAYVLNVSTQT